MMTTHNDGTHLKVDVKYLLLLLLQYLSMFLFEDSGN